MKILITGSAGFIGSHLAEKLKSEQHDVSGVDNFETGRADNWPETFKLDITDRPLFYEYANLVKPDAVIHCAASYKNPNHWHVDTEVNVAGAINVAAVATHHNAAIIYFQTVLPPISSYAISKIAGEHYLRLCKQPLTVYRLASVYGPRNVSGPIPTFYKRIKAGQVCNVATGATRDFVYVGDLVKRVLEGEWGQEPGTYDIRTGIETPIVALPFLIGEWMSIDPTVEMQTQATDDVAHYEMSGDLLPNPTRVADGIGDAVHWYEQNGVAETYTHLAIKD